MKWVAAAVVLLLASLFGGAQPAPSPQEILIQPIQRGGAGLELSVDKGCGAVYQHGEELHVVVKSPRDGYLTLLDFSPNGKVKVIFPNAYYQDNFIRAGKEYTIPGDLLPFKFVIAPPDGKEILFAVVTETDRALTSYDFSQIFPELAGTAVEVAQAVASAIEIIPSREWWAAAMCYFYIGKAPTSEIEGWSLFVGINRYYGASYEPYLTINRRTHILPELKYCVADAHSMATVFADQFGHQRVLVGGQATYQAIKEAITEWLATAPQDATVLIYFAGHGARFPDEDGDEKDGWDEAIVSYDLKPILDDVMASWLAQISAKNVVMILDTSFAGSTSWDQRTFRYRKEYQSDFPELTDGFADDLAAMPTAAPAGLEPIGTKCTAVLVAVSPNEVANEHNEFGHGVFTYFLLQGLKGSADLDRDGQITTQELYTYVATSISEEFNQHPVFYGHCGQSLSVLKLGE